MENLQMASGYVTPMNEQVRVPPTTFESFLQQGREREFTSSPNPLLCLLRGQFSYRCRSCTGLTGPNNLKAHKRDNNVLHIWKVLKQYNVKNLKLCTLLPFNANSRTYDVSTSPAGLCISLKPNHVPRVCSPKRTTYINGLNATRHRRGSHGRTLSQYATSDFLFRFRFYYRDFPRLVCSSSKRLICISPRQLSNFRERTEANTIAGEEESSALNWNQIN